jgi:hypothetical protein
MDSSIRVAASTRSGERVTNEAMVRTNERKEC